MEFNTKFNKGDTVCFLFDNKPLSAVISGIEIKDGNMKDEKGNYFFYSEGPLVIYHFEKFTKGIPENIVCGSLDELKESLSEVWKIESSESTSYTITTEK